MADENNNNNQAPVQGSGETKQRTMSASNPTIAVQNGKKYGESVIHTLVFVRVTDPPFNPTFKFEGRAPKSSPQSACVSSCPKT